MWWRPFIGERHLDWVGMGVVGLVVAGGWLMGWRGWWIAAGVVLWLCVPVVLLSVRWLPLPPDMTEAPAAEPGGSTTGAPVAEGRG